MSDTSGLGEDFLAKMDDSSAVTKTPSAAGWARRYPKRTLVLGIVSAVSVVLFLVFQSTATTAPVDSDPTAFFAPWRYALASTVLLWVAVVSGAGALFSWLMHVRDREYLMRELVFRAQASRRR